MTDFLDACYEAIRVQESSIPDTIRSAKILSGLDLRDSQRVVFVGAGDSYAVAEFGKWAFLGSGVNAYSISPTEIRYVPLNSNCTVIAVSASGRSLSTLEAIRTAKKSDARVIVLTDNESGKAAEETPELWITRASVDSYNVSPASPTTTAMAYILKIASELDSQIKKDLQHDVKQLTKIGMEMMDWAQTEGEAISELMSPGSPLYIIADGPNYVSSQIGMMKFNEFSIIKGISALLEEFCHHHVLSINDDEQAILISNNPITLEDKKYLSVLSDTLGMRVYNLHNDIGLRTALAQAIPNAIALQIAAHYTVRQHNPNVDSFKMPHAKAFQIY